jgi:hypothetical protein
MHEDLNKKHEQLAQEHREFVQEQRTFVKEMKAYAADVRDVIRRLGVIAEARSIQLADHERRLDDLE